MEEVMPVMNGEEPEKEVIGQDEMVRSKLDAGNFQRGPNPKSFQRGSNPKVDLRCSPPASARQPERETSLWITYWSEYT